jgi:hypothetical protein
MVLQLSSGDPRVVSRENPRSVSNLSIKVSNGLGSRAIFPRVRALSIRHPIPSCPKMVEDPIRNSLIHSETGYGKGQREHEVQARNVHTIRSLPSIRAIKAPDPEPTMRSKYSQGRASGPLGSLPARPETSRIKSCSISKDDKVRTPPSSSDRTRPPDTSVQLASIKASSVSIVRRSSMPSQFSPVLNEAENVIELQSVRNTAL